MYIFLLFKSLIFGGFILGFLLGIVKSRDILLGPNSKDIVQKKYLIDNKCYSLEPKETNCGLFDKHI